MLHKAFQLAKAGLIVMVTLFVFWMAVPLFAGAPSEQRPPVTPGPRPTVTPTNGDNSGQVWGSIRGTICEDRDGDGKCAGTGEPRLPGVWVELVNSGNLIAVYSGGDGTYAPVAMGLGVWTVTVKPPAGWRAASTSPLTAPLSSDQRLVLGVDFCLVKNPAALPPEPSSSGPSAASYVVQPGDDLSRIGVQLGSTANELAAYNHLANPNLIYAGQVILIPPSSGPPAGSYVVQPGDNLFRIGLRFGFTVSELAAYNNIANPNVIYVGQVILIPPS